METHKELDVWKESLSLVSTIYQRTSQFPSREKYGLTDQVRRSAVSITANISEGYGRLNSKELMRFLKISFGSLCELETLLMISFNLGYIDEIDQTFFQEKIKLITAQLSGLIKSIKSRIESNQYLG